MTVVSGGVQLRGWTIDPDVVDPINVHVYVDGRAVSVLTANASRPDVGRAYPGYGSNHGIDAKIRTGSIASISTCSAPIRFRRYLPAWRY